jgi:AraC-like DNA-binding protein
MKAIPFKIPKNAKESVLLQEDHQSHFYDKYHQHSEYQLTLIVASEGTLIAGDHVGNFYPGDVYLFGSNLPHVFKNSDVYFDENNTEQAHSLSIFFDEKSFGGIFDLPEGQRIKSFVQHARGGVKFENEALAYLHESLPPIFGKDGFDRILAILDLLNKLSGMNGSEPLSTSENYKTYDIADGKRMNDILKFTMDESHREISLEEVAQIASMTPEAFCRYFKARTRKTYTTFLNELRVSNACKILMNQRVPIYEVSATVGFNNMSNFNRTFKKITGMTPSEYISKTK